MTWRERVAGLRVDTTPLRQSRDFRLLFWAGTVFYLGGMVTYVALPYQLYTLTGSNFAVGALGIVELVPLVVFGLYGGALADHVDRRRMLVLAGAAQVVLTGLLAVNAFLPDPRAWPIYVLGALLAAAQSLQRPSKEALEPRTVEHGQIMAASALSSLGVQVGLLAGPAVGGVLLAAFGVGWCFVVNVAALLVATALFAALRPYPVTDRSNPPSLRGSPRGSATRCAAATCSAPTWWTWSRCSWPCRPCSTPPWSRTSSTSPRCSACSTASARSAACSRRSPRAGPGTCTTTAGR